LLPLLPILNKNQSAMNEEKHWDSIGINYNDEIFDVFRSNKKGKLQKYLQKHANKKHSATDFGCGTGKSFKYLAPSFENVLAIDISQKLIDIAKTSAHSNITFKRLDLTDEDLDLPRTDFAFCCNVAILPEQEGNHSILRNIQQTLRRNGAAVVVVPSLESALYSSWRLVDWYRKEGVDTDKIPESELSYFNENKDIAQGVVFIDGVPTKHYLQTELEVLFNAIDLDVNTIDRLEYDWTTEFDSPPKWMGEPYPWDWLIECRKK
jgi:SAM-dependent methyltransferase